MKIYLAGPMSGIPEFNFPAFMSAASILRKGGHEVFNPAEADVEEFGDFSKKCPDGTHEEAAKVNPKITLRYVLKKDLVWICDNAEAIALLPGWENSKGVSVELALSKALELEIIELKPYYWLNEFTGETGIGYNV